MPTFLCRNVKFIHTLHNLADKTVTIKDKPTTAEIQYCLMIKPKSSSTTDVKCNINSITINYKLENNTP